MLEFELTGEEVAELLSEYLSEDDGVPEGNYRVETEFAVSNGKLHHAIVRFVPKPDGSAN